MREAGACGFKMPWMGWACWWKVSNTGLPWASLTTWLIIQPCSKPPHGAPAESTALSIELKSRIWYNPELKSVNFIVPGMIAVIMMIVGAIMTALSIVKEKEHGTMEQILVTPLKPAGNFIRGDRATARYARRPLACPRPNARRKNG